MVCVGIKKCGKDNPLLGRLLAHSSDLMLAFAMLAMTSTPCPTPQTPSVGESRKMVSQQLTYNFLHQLLEYL